MFIVNLLTIATLASQTVSGMPIASANEAAPVRVAHHSTTVPTVKNTTAVNNATALHNGTSEAASSEPANEERNCMEHLNECTPGELAAVIVSGSILGLIGLGLVGVLGWTVIESYRQGKTAAKPENQFADVVEGVEDEFFLDVKAAETAEDVWTAISKRSAGYNAAVDHYAGQAPKATRALQMRQAMVAEHEHQFAEIELNGYIESIRTNPNPKIQEFIDDIENSKQIRVKAYETWLTERKAGKTSLEAEKAVAKEQVAAEQNAAKEGQSLEEQFTARMQAIEERYAEQFEKSGKLSDLMSSAYERQVANFKALEEFSAKGYQPATERVSELLAQGEEAATTELMETLEQKIRSSGKGDAGALADSLRQKYATYKEEEVNTNSKNKDASSNTQADNDDVEINNQEDAHASDSESDVDMESPTHQSDSDIDMPQADAEKPQGSTDSLFADTDTPSLKPESLTLPAGGEANLKELEDQSRKELQEGFDKLATDGERAVADAFGKLHFGR